MDDIRRLPEHGYSNRFTALNRASVVGWAPIPLRLIVRYGFMQYGFAKLSKGPDAFSAILHAIGLSAPHVMARITILIEVSEELAVLLGVLVPHISLPMAALLFVAIFTVHLHYGFSSIKLIRMASGRAHRTAGLRVWPALSCLPHGARHGWFWADIDRRLSPEERIAHRARSAASPLQQRRRTGRRS